MSSNIEDLKQSPIYQAEKRNRKIGSLKLKGDQNNFNEISESILEENLDRFTDEAAEIPLKRFNIEIGG